MARLRDIKVGKSVWIKKGKTPLQDFAWAFEKVIGDTVGTEGRVDCIDPKDSECTVSVSFGDKIWWYPVDWISLTPPIGTSKTLTKDSPAKSNPGKGTSTKSTLVKDNVVEKLYVAHDAGDTTNPGTLDEVVEFMRNEWGYDDEDIRDATFYECTKVDVQYTPAEYTPAKFTLT